MAGSGFWPEAISDPSLYPVVDYLYVLHRAQSKSPKSDRKNIGIPDQREFLEQKSATDCLTSMILDCKKVFRVPEDFLSKCSLSYMEVGEPAPLSLLGNDGDYSTHLDCCFQGLMKVSLSCLLYSSC